MWTKDIQKQFFGRQNEFENVPLLVTISVACTDVMPLCRSRSYFTTEGRSVSQSVSKSWYRVPFWDLPPDITSCRNVAV
jgi:hypothetical protein